MDSHGSEATAWHPSGSAANLPTKILDFRGFDSSIVLILRGGTLMSIGSSSEVLSQRVLAGIVLARRLGRGAERGSVGASAALSTANLRTKILDVRGFHSSVTLRLRGGILMSTGNFPEMLHRAILVGMVLV